MTNHLPITSCNLPVSCTCSANSPPQHPSECPGSNFFVTTSVAIALALGFVVGRCSVFQAPARRIPMGKHMDEKTKALCYFYRHPPPKSGVQPMPFCKIPSLLPCTPRPHVHQVRKAVKTFHFKKKTKGRAKGVHRPHQQRTSSSCELSSKCASHWGAAWNRGTCGKSCLLV